MALISGPSWQDHSGIVWILATVCGSSVRTRGGARKPSPPHKSEDGGGCPDGAARRTVPSGQARLASFGGSACGLRAKKSAMGSDSVQMSPSTGPSKEAKATGLGTSEPRASTSNCRAETESLSLELGRRDLEPQPRTRTSKLRASALNSDIETESLNHELGNQDLEPQPRTRTSRPRALASNLDIKTALASNSDAETWSLRMRLHISLSQR